LAYAFGVGREAPLFTARTTDGDEIVLARFRGDWFPVIVFLPAELPDVDSRLLRLEAAAGRLWGLRAQLLVVREASAGEPQSAPPGVALPVITDDGALAANYGALQPDGRLRALTVIIDRAGKIVWTAEDEAASDPDVIAVALREVAR
jgi:peroxiredoxin